MSRKVPFMVYFDKETLDELTVIHKRDRIPISMIIRDAVIEYLGWLRKTSKDSNGGTDEILE